MLKNSEMRRKREGKMDDGSAETRETFIKGLLTVFRPRIDCSTRLT